MVQNFTETSENTVGPSEAAGLAAMVDVTNNIGSQSRNHKSHIL